jgi:hypothetical protein
MSRQMSATERYAHEWQHALQQRQNGIYPRLIMIREPRHTWIATMEDQWIVQSIMQGYAPQWGEGVGGLMYKLPTPEEAKRIREDYRKKRLEGEVRRVKHNLSSQVNEGGVPTGWVYCPDVRVDEYLDRWANAAGYSLDRDLQIVRLVERTRPRRGFWRWPWVAR